ncbi:MAG TPA: hypothetical protein VFO05_02975 [Candidatus Limnocylindrales bacterium]|nr:hypothetical protein [Candidatus Limnocylindrales bacterium]
MLGPLGLTQKGRSRTWLDDRIWHLIVVEFQPSSWSPGTYVNVAAMWLWNVTDYISFDYGPYRVQEFESADTDDWPERCRDAASLAAAHVQDLRAEITDLAAAARATSAIDQPGWPTFHAAIASGLVGDVERARELFDRLLVEGATEDWHRAMQTKAAELRALLGDPAAFRARVVDDIERTRSALRLPARAASEIGAALEAGVTPGT